MFEFFKIAGVNVGLKFWEKISRVIKWFRLFSVKGNLLQSSSVLSHRHKVKHITIHLFRLPLEKQMELIPNVLAGIEAKPTMHQVIHTYLKLGFIKIKWTQYLLIYFVTDLKNLYAISVPSCFFPIQESLLSLCSQH